MNQVKSWFDHFLYLITWWCSRLYDNIQVDIDMYIFVNFNLYVVVSIILNNLSCVTWISFGILYIYTSVVFSLNVKNKTHDNTIRLSENSTIQSLGMLVQMLSIYKYIFTGSWEHFISATLL